MRVSLRRTPLAIVGAVTIALTLVVCASTSSAAERKTTEAPIVVGVICTCSAGGGFGGILHPGEEVYQAWADSVNAAGGIDGHPVKLITEDDTGNPGTGLTDAQTLVSDHVDAVADLSLVDQTFESTLEAAKIPVVGALTYEGPFGTNPDFYPEAETNDANGVSVISVAKAAGATNLANIYCAEAAICAQSVPVYEAAGKKLGVPVIYNAAISATAPNYTAQCVAAQQAHVTSIFIGEAAPLIIKLAGDCAAQGYNPIYALGGGGYAADLNSAPGLKKDSTIAFSDIPFTADTPAVHTAKAAIDKYYPGLFENPTLFTEQNFFSWISGELLVDAVKAGGLTAGATPSSAEIVKGLHSLKGDTVDGLTPPLTYAAGKPNTVDCWFDAQIKNGKLTLLNHDRASCEKG